MIESIFMESNDTLGLLYNRYCKLPEKISNFLDIIEEAVNYADKKGIPDNDKFNLTEALKNFKKDVEIDVKIPDTIHSDELEKQRSKIKKLKNDVELSLNRLARVKKRARFGNNLIKGIIIKPKVYQNTIDEDKEINVNSFIRSINRCMDWVEKIILDTMNLADQDLNILTLVKQVYFKKIYEAVEAPDDEDLLETNIEDYWNESYLSYDNDQNDEETDDSVDSDNNNGIEPVEDILGYRIKDDTDEYFPIFSIVVSYDFSRWKTANKDQRGMIIRGKTIRAVTHGDKYTHTILSFDTSLENLYHFIGTGIIKDSIMENSSFEITNSIYINVTFVTKEEKEIILKEVNNMLTNSTDTRYDTIQLINQMLGKSKHADKRMICSTFVGYLLACGNLKNLHRDFSLIRPEDITLLPRAFYVINFRDREDFINRKGEFDKKVKQIYVENIEEIKDYNNMLPKVIIKSKLKEKGSLDAFFDWMARKCSQ